MNPKVLFVDDDPSLLRSLERNLCFDFDLATAESGPAALELLAAPGAPSVVVTDMRMPGMDGVQFIAEARKLAPDAVFLMLTGNQDIGTAVTAVNSGSVFRFLTKPCEIAEVKAALEAAARQHELVHAERELLNKTFTGAVGVLTEALAAARPATFHRFDGIADLVEHVRQGVGIADRWEFRLAARLVTVGFTCLNDYSLSRYLTSPPTSDDWRATEAKACGIAARMLQRIPRLGPVAAIIEAAPRATGEHCHANPKTAGAIAQTGANLLQVALVWESFVGQGANNRQAADDMHQVLPNIPREYLEVLAAAPAENDGLPGVELALEDLRPGMVLHGDASARNGAPLLRRGVRLTEASIERLRDYDATIHPLKPIMVVDQQALVPA